MGSVKYGFCTECGAENEDNATFCQNCGTRIKPKENKKGLSKLINWKAIGIGALTYFVLIVLVVICLYIISSDTYNNLTDSSFILIYVFVMVITGIITGFFSEKEYLNGIINSVIIAVFYSIIIGLSSGLGSLILALIILGVLGIIGGLIGVVIYRKYNNYNITG